MLYISTDDKDGKKARRKELQQSAQVLGLRSNAVKVINNAKLEDGESWDTYDILNEIENLSWSDLDIIVTFDKEGAIHHPNHMSLLSAALLSNAKRIYVLRTRKRISLFFAGDLIVRAMMNTRQQDIRDTKEVMFVSRPSYW